jgi:hypothetical protein
MHLDAGAVQGNRIDVDANDLGLLQLFEDLVQHSGLGPAIHACVDRVPIAKTGRQTTPLATMLCDVKDRIEHVQIGKTDIATLSGQEPLNLSELGRCDFHVMK